MEACRLCGREITHVSLVSGRLISQLSRRVPFCSPLCASAAALEAILMRQALVKLENDGVTCLLCNRKMEILGTHFLRVHGVPKTKSLTERQLLYGVPQGSRMSSTRLLRVMTEHGLRNGMPFEARGRSPAVGNGNRQRKGRAPQGMGHLANREALRERLRALAIKKGAEKHAASLCHPWKCKRCGKEEIRNANGAKRVYCDMDCRSPSVEWTCANPGCGKKVTADTFNARKRRYCSMECRPVPEQTKEALRMWATKAHEESLTLWTCANPECGKTDMRGAHGHKVKFCNLDCERPKQRWECQGCGKVEMRRAWRAKKFKFCGIACRDGKTPRKASHANG